VDREPLIFYHFQGLKRINRWFYDLGMGEYGPPSAILKRFIYIPTIREMVIVEREISRMFPPLGGLTKCGDLRQKRYRFRSILKRLIKCDLAISMGKWVF